jgi:DNA mismatch endonuclease, patch repair protein
LKHRHDNMSQAKRSAVMASIRSRGTMIEKLMADAFSQLGIEFEGQPKLFGNPDFILPRKGTVVFCDGDFWHGYRLGRNPRLDIKDNREFWMTKIKSNMRRDRKVDRVLSNAGWKIIRLWEHDIREDPIGCARRMLGLSEGT